MSENQTMRHVERTGVLCALCLLVLGKVAAAVPAELPYAAHFDNQAVGSPLNALADQGWWASDNAIVITNEVCRSPSNSVFMPCASQATNAVNAAGQSNLWTEIHINAPAAMDDDRPDVNTNAAVMVCLDQSGCLALYDPVSAEWALCSNDAWGVSVIGFHAGGWAQLDIFEDFVSKQAAIFLDGRCIRERWPFINTGASAGSGLRLDSGSADALHFDDVTLGASAPGSMTNDWDADGMVDAAEIQAYGSINRWMGTRVVTNGTTIQDALNLLLPGEVIVVSAGAYVEDITISNAAALYGTNVTITGTLAVTGGVSAVFAQTSNVVFSGAATVSTGCSLILTNGYLSLAELSIGPGGQLKVINGTLSVNGLVLTGTFTLDSSWKGSAVVAATLPLAEGFELYGEGVPLAALGYFGWAASSPDTVIQRTTVHDGAQAVDVAAGTMISNAVVADAASSNVVWTDVYIHESVHMDEDRPDVDPDSTVMLFLDRSGCLGVYDPAAGDWVLCTNDAWGNDISGLYTGGWARISLYQNYTSHTAAVFMNDHLVREQLRFINTNRNVLAGVQLMSGAATPARMDSLRMQTGVPGDLLGNRDGDDIRDANEIQSHGTAVLFRQGPGSIFKFR